MGPSLPLRQWELGLFRGLSVLLVQQLAAVAATEPGCSFMALLPPHTEISCTYIRADEGSCISQLTLSTPLHGADLGHAAVDQPVHVFRCS